MVTIPSCSNKKPAPVMRTGVRSVRFFPDDQLDDSAVSMISGIVSFVVESVFLVYS